MRLISGFALLGLLIATLGGCAFPSSIKPGASADELLQKLGKPTETRPDPQGESWDYVYGPEGLETWRFGIDRSRKVSSATQLLTAERLQRIVAGVSTQAEVRNLLGAPREMVSLGSETVWEWRVSLAPEFGIYVVRFDSKGIATGYNVLRDIRFDDGRDSGP